MAKKKQNAVIGTFAREDGTIGYLRNNFVFYLTWKQIADRLPDEDRLVLYDMITDYALYGKLPPEDHPGYIHFLTPKYQIDQMNERYEDGITGGRPSNNHKADRQPGEGDPGLDNGIDYRKEVLDKVERMRNDPNWHGFSTAEWEAIETLEEATNRKYD